MTTHHTDEKKPARGGLICRKTGLLQKDFHKIVLSEIHARLAIDAGRWRSPSVLLVKVALACNLVIVYGINHAIASESAHHGKDFVNISLRQGAVGTVSDGSCNRLERGDSAVSVIPAHGEAVAKDDAKPKGNDGCDSRVLSKNLTYHYLLLELLIYFILGMLCGSGVFYSKRRVDE